MIKTRTFLLSLPIEEAKCGETYDGLPLHCTIFQYFDHSGEIGGLTGAIERVLVDSKPIDLVAGAYDDTFGPKKNVAVYRIANWFDVHHLHTELWHGLYECRVRIRNPEWAGLGYQPHATVGATAFETGSVSRVSHVNLVERLPDRRKKVIETLPLGRN